MSAVTYRERSPGPALAGLVDCFWTIRSTDAVGTPHLNRVLPDGCMDLVFNLGDPPVPAEGEVNRLSSYVVGTMRRPLPLWLSGRVDLLGVRFRPGGAAAFVRVPASEVTDGVLPLSEVWRHLAADLESRLHETPGERRLPVLREVLERRVPASVAHHPAVARATGLIARSRGRVSVADLERALGITRRHLERLFAERIGLSPKTACRVARFRGALDALRREPGIAWSRLAVDCGFYDQAHLIREFRAFAGVTPAAFRAERAGVASVQYDAGQGS